MSTQISGKETVNSIDKGIDQVTEDPKTLQVANLEVWQGSFAIWREYNEAYTYFVLQATQQVLNDALTFRENLGQIMSDNFKQAHILSGQERQMVLDSTGLIQEQARATAEETGKMITTASKVMTTTVLFSNWAIEHAAKMFISM